MSAQFKMLKDPSQPPPFSMASKLLIKDAQANSYCFTVSCVPKGMLIVSHWFLFVSIGSK